MSTNTFDNNNTNAPVNKIKNVIGVMSGKGGVGKSTISYLIANALNKGGYSVGIMDADVTGPSIPKLFNLENKRLMSDGRYIFPYETNDGIKIVSMNLLLDDERKPVIWRGPILTKVVQQFWTDVHWEDLDFLIVDMPPGTSDVALTVMQNVKLDGLFIVTTPHDMVELIVAKSVNMAESMKIKVLGLIENMSYIVCPKCGEKINFFGESSNNENVVAKIPMVKELTQITKNGLQQSAEIDNILDTLKNIVTEKIGYKK